jgi:hypothetical protein
MEGNMKIRHCIADLEVTKLAVPYVTCFAEKCTKSEI